MNNGGKVNYWLFCIKILLLAIKNWIRFDGKLTKWWSGPMIWLWPLHLHHCDVTGSWPLRCQDVNDSHSRNGESLTWRSALLVYSATSVFWFPGDVLMWMQSSCSRVDHMWAPPSRPRSSVTETHTANSVWLGGLLFFSSLSFLMFSLLDL